MYHIISEPLTNAEKLLACSPEMFKKQMQYINNNGFNVVGLSEAIQAIIEEKPLQDRSVVLTFDDGFSDVYKNAYPILKEFQFPATVFVVADLVGDTNQWMIGDNKIKRQLCTWEQIEEMSQNGFCIGSHTNNHVKLDQVSRIKARNEIFQSKRTIESKIGIKVDSFAYPYGRYTLDSKHMLAEAGYIGACSTLSGYNYIFNNSTDPYLLRRLDIFGTDNMWQFKQKLKFGANVISSMQLFRYYAGQALKRIRKVTP